MNTQGEERILNIAVEQFNATTGMRMNVLEQEVRQGGNEVDAVGRIDALDTDVVFAIKRNVSIQTLGMIAIQMEKIQEPGILVADYINPKMADRLRELGIWFVDTAGNAYINNPPLYIYVKGMKAHQVPEAEKKNRAFQPTGLKVIFALLHDAQLINATYRQIAEKAKVALGTVGWVLNGLRDLGYLVEYDKKHRRLKEKEKLIERWAIAYPEVLRPKLLIGRFTTNDLARCKQLELHHLGACWGGEVAAEKLTGYLKPEEGILYAHGETAALQLKCQLRRDPAGRIELVTAFWDPGMTNVWHPDTAPPLVIYADLLATGDPRNIETAKLIYEQELARLVRED